MEMEEQQEAAVSFFCLWPARAKFWLGQTLNFLKGEGARRQA